MRQIMIFIVVIVSIANALAGPGIIEFRSVSKPATRAPFSPQEMIVQAKLAQHCDLGSENPIALVPPTAVSSRLQQLLDDDQATRTAEPIDLSVADRADRTRRLEAVEYVLKNQLTNTLDFINTGIIFQHGTCPDSFLLAHQLAGYAIVLSEGRTGTGRQAPEARWLYAATFDRYLLNSGLPQRFGTQYRFDGPDCQYVLEPFDPNITNEERTLYEVATFDAAQAQAAAAKCPVRK